MAELAVGESILDVGCAQLPNPYLRARQVVGLDLAEMDVRPPYTDHVVGNVEAAPDLLGGRLFDSVLLGEIIEHIERPYDVLRLLRRLLARGGRLILSTPNPLGIPVVFAEYLLLRKLYYTTDHKFYFPPRWVWRLLEGSGYRVVRTIGCGVSLMGWRLPAPRSLSYQLLYVAEPAP